MLVQTVHSGLLDFVHDLLKLRLSKAMLQLASSCRSFTVSGRKHSGSINMNLQDISKATPLDPMPAHHWYLPLIERLPMLVLGSQDINLAVFEMPAVPDSAHDSPDVVAERAVVVCEEGQSQRVLHQTQCSLHGLDVVDSCESDRVDKEQETDSCHTHQPQVRQILWYVLDGSSCRTA